MSGASGHGGVRWSVPLLPAAGRQLGGIRILGRNPCWKFFAKIMKMSNSLTVLQPNSLDVCLTGLRLDCLTGLRLGCWTSLLLDIGTGLLLDC